MLHAKTFSVGDTTRSGRATPLPLQREPARIGALVVFGISLAVLVVSALLSRAAPSAGSLGEPLFAKLRCALGIEGEPIGVVSDSEIAVTAGTGARTFVAGRILDAEGNAVAGSAVRVASDARPGCDWVTSTGADGAFRVEGVAAGKLHVAAYDSEAGSVESTTLDAVAARNVVLVLGSTVVVSGTVLDLRGAPIARAAVKVESTSGASDRIVIADEEGRFTLRTRARGSDRLTIWARGFEPSVSTLGPAGSDVGLGNVRLRASPPVRGVVMDGSGAAVAGARVSACPGKEAETTMSDASGAFELPATTVGCWVSASHARFSGSRPARIVGGRTLTVRLGAGGAIEGSAVDERGRPIALFSVAIASFEPADEGSVATRAGETADHLRGSFRVDDLAPGTYVLRFSAEGRVDTDSRAIEIAHGRVVRGEQIVLAAMAEESAVTLSLQGVTEVAGSGETEGNETPSEEPVASPDVEPAP